MFRLLRLLLKVFLVIALGVGAWVVYEVVTFPDIDALRTRNPESTAIIDQRVDEAREKKLAPKRVQTWVPLEKISPHLWRAVIAGEDANFTAHRGFDYAAIQKAWEDARREAEKEAKAEGGGDENDWIPPLPNFRRGASTITQQLAKNLYLSTERSFFRKGREAVITYFLERKLSKRRILELYLNVIEWGDGIYGAEAAAQYYFGKSAAGLTAAEAARLSAMIPNPRTVFNPQKNPRRVARRQRIILRGMAYAKLP